MGVDCDRPVRAGRHRNRGRAAEKLGAERAGGDPGLGEFEPPVQVRERRGVGVRSDFVVDELVFAGQLERFRIPDRDVEPEREAARARRTHALGHAVQCFRHRAFGDEAEEIARLVLGADLDPDAHVPMKQIGNARAHTACLDVEDRPFRRDDAHALALEDEIAREAARLRPALGVTEVGVGHFRDDLENSGTGLIERKLRKLPFQPQPDVVRVPASDRGLEIIDDRPGQQGNVAVDGPAVGAEEIPGEVDDARAALSAREPAEQRSGDVAVGEREGVEGEIESIRREFPADARCERIELQGTLGDDPGQVDRDPLRAERDAAALLARLEPSGEPRESGNPVVGARGEPREAAPQAVVLRILRVARPGGLQVADAAARLGCGQARTGGLRKRQVFGESRERRELDRIGVDLAAGRRPTHPKIGGRDDDTGPGLERELAAEDFEGLPIALARAQPPAQIIKLQKRSVLGHAARNIGERDVGRERAYVERIVDPAPPGNEIRVFELGVHLPDAFARIGELNRIQLAAHVERGGELGGRLRLESEPMAPQEAVAQD